MKETAGQSGDFSETNTTGTEDPDWTSRLVLSLRQSLNTQSYSSSSSATNLVA